MRYRLEQESQSPKEQKETRDLLKLATCFLEHENIFLGEEISFFKQKGSLKDLVEMYHEIHNEEHSSKTKNITLPDEDFQTDIDQYYIGAALSFLIENIYQKAQKIKFIIDPKHHTLQIHQDSPLLFQDEHSNWSDEKNNYYEISLWLAKSIFQNFKVEIDSTKGMISLKFPTEKT